MPSRWGRLTLLAPLLLACSDAGLDGGGMFKPRSPAPRLTTPHIVFSSNRTGTIGIHLYDPADSSIVRISPSGSIEQDPAISPDGVSIAFVRYEPDGRFHLMTMAVDGGNRTNCTNETTVSDTGPHWSPDSRFLVFTRFDRSTTAHDVYTIRSNGDSLLRVTSDGRSTALDWSPDGARLLLVRDSTDLSDVTTTDPRGGNPASLFGPLWLRIRGADYSPDGSRIIFTYERHAVSSPSLDLSNADGSERRALVAGTDFAYEGGIGRPSWSPDGSLVVFPARRDHETDDLYTIPLDGTDPTPLLAGSPWESTPDWGPKP